MRISDWSSDVCSSDLGLSSGKFDVIVNQVGITPERKRTFDFSVPYVASSPQLILRKDDDSGYKSFADLKGKKLGVSQGRSEEHTSELQSLMRISYAVFCLKKKIANKHKQRGDIRTRIATEHKMSRATN